MVIVGGGFGGLYAAQELKRAPVEVTLVDRRNFHLFQPLLYQVATGGLSPADISSPLRAVLRRQQNARVLLGEVVDLDPVARRLRFADGELAYDSLVIATGVTHHYFGRHDLEVRAPGLKTIEDATRIRSRLLSAFERAERESDPERRRALLTFVLVGGGPTGVELAGALGELAHQTLARDFREIDPTAARIVLVEATEAILAGFPGVLERHAIRSLSRLGVEVRRGTRLTAIDGDEVRLAAGDREETLAAATVLWAAGVEGSPLGRILARRTGAELDRAGRVVVAADCSLPGHPEIFVIGDLACFLHQGGRPLPGVAPVAMQMGRYVSRRLVARLAQRPTGPFRYRDKGSLAVIGRAAAVARLGRLRIWGFPAWVLWLVVHLLYIVEHENRVLIALQWGWSYLTRKRGARLITGR